MAGEQRDDVSTIIDRLSADLEDAGNAYDAGLAEQGQEALGRAQRDLVEASRLAKRNGRPQATPVANNGPFLAPEPQALEAEENILGACMLAPAATRAAAAEVAPGDFYRDSHAHIFTAILYLDEHEIAVDPITVADYLEQHDLIEKAGGRERIFELAALVPASAGVAQWAKIVRERALQRNLNRQIMVSPQDPEAIGEAAAMLTRARITGGVSRAYDAADWLSTQPEGTPSVWGQGDQVLWAEGEPLMIYGPDGVGKTSVAQQVVLGLCGVRLEPFLGMPLVRADRPVLYLACDRPLQARRSLYRMIPREQHEALRGKLLVWCGPLPFAIPLKPRALLEFCLMHEAGYLIIDSLKDVAVQLTDPETALKVNQAFQWLNQGGVDLLVLHHPRKDPAGQPARPKTLEDVYGDRNFTAGMGSVVSFYGKAGDPIVSFEHLKQPAAEVGPFKVLHDHERGESRLYEFASVEEILAKASRPLTVGELASQVYGSPDPSQAEKQKIRHTLRKLLAQGLAIEYADNDGGPAAYGTR